MKKVAIALSEKKKKSLKDVLECLRFENTLFIFRKQKDFEFYEFDLDDPKTFLKVDLLIHKLTDDMISQEEKSINRTRNFMVISLDLNLELFKRKSKRNFNGRFEKVGEDHG